MLKQKDIRRMLNHVLATGATLKAYGEGELMGQCDSEKDITDFIRDMCQCDVCELTTSDGHWILLVHEYEGSEVCDYTEKSEHLVDIMEGIE